MKNLFKSLFLPAAVFSISVLSLLSNPSAASAEQAKADEYRKIIESGNFYIEHGTAVEYDDPKYAEMFQNYSKSILCIAGDKKVKYSTYRIGDIMVMMNKDKAKIFKKASNFYPTGKKLLQNVLYRDGYYYQFFGKNDALRADKSQLNMDSIEPLDNLDIEEIQETVERYSYYWHQIPMLFSLPEFFKALVPNSPYFADTLLMMKTTNFSYESECVESGTETVLGNTMNFDKYVVTLYKDGTKVMLNDKDGDETDIPYSTTYKLYYDENGDLKYAKIVERSIEKLGDRGGLMHMVGGAMHFPGILNMNSPEIKVEQFEVIYKITTEIPADIFDMPKGCKVYTIKTGTMSELLGEPTLVEEY